MDSENIGDSKNIPSASPPKNTIRQVKKGLHFVTSQIHATVFLLQSKINPSAPAFQPPKTNYDLFPVVNVGPSKVPVNAKIWDKLANNRVLPTLPQGIQAQLSTRLSFEPTISQLPIQPVPGSLFDAFVSFLHILLRHLFFHPDVSLPERAATV